MKITLNRTNRGFTLIEMIGVLAVIAILAAVLIPKVFEAINSSRISNAAITCNTVKTGIADHYAKWGSLTVDGSSGSAVAIATFPETAYDKILVSEGFLDKPFAVKIGNGVDGDNNVTITDAVGATPAAAAVGSGTYDLDGNGSVDTPAGVHVVEAVIACVSLEDAQSVDRLIDGPDANMSSPTSTTGDTQGRVKWGATSVANGSGFDINIYLTHR